MSPQPAAHRPPRPLSLRLPRLAGRPHCEAGGPREPGSPHPADGLSAGGPAAPPPPGKQDSPLGGSAALPPRDTRRQLERLRAESLRRPRALWPASSVLVCVRRGRRCFYVWPAAAGRPWPPNRAAWGHLSGPEFCWMSGSSCLTTPPPHRGVSQAPRRMFLESLPKTHSIGPCPGHWGPTGPRPSPGSGPCLPSLLSPGSFRPVGLVWGTCWASLPWTPAAPACSRVWARTAVGAGRPLGPGGGEPGLPAPTGACGGRCLIPPTRTHGLLSGSEAAGERPRSLQPFPGGGRAPRARPLGVCPPPGLRAWRPCLWGPQPDLPATTRQGLAAGGAGRAACAGRRRGAGRRGAGMGG